MWKTFNGSNVEALKAVADHPFPAQVSGFLIAAGFAVAIPAVAALARVLDSHVTRLAVPLFAVGAGLTLADIAFGLKVHTTWPPAILRPAAVVVRPDERLGRRAVHHGNRGPRRGGAAGLRLGGSPAPGAGLLVGLCHRGRRGGHAGPGGGVRRIPQFLTFLALGVAVLARSRRGQGAAGQGTAPPEVAAATARS